MMFSSQRFNSGVQLSRGPQQFESTVAVVAQAQAHPTLQKYENQPHPPIVSIAEKSNHIASSGTGLVGPITAPQLYTILCTVSKPETRVTAAKEFDSLWGQTNERMQDVIILCASLQRAEFSLRAERTLGVKLITELETTGNDAIAVWVGENVIDVNALMSKMGEGYVNVFTFVLADLFN